MVPDKPIKILKFRKIRHDLFQELSVRNLRVVYIEVVYIEVVYIEVD